MIHSHSPASQPAFSSPEFQSSESLEARTGFTTGRRGEERQSQHTQPVRSLTPPNPSVRPNTNNKIQKYFDSQDHPTDCLGFSPKSMNDKLFSFFRLVMAIGTFF